LFQAEDGIRARNVTGVQTCALPILRLIQLQTFPIITKTQWKQTSVIAILQALLLQEIKTMPSSLKPVESMEESLLMLLLKTNKNHLYLLPEFILSFKDWDCFINK